MHSHNQSPLKNKWIVVTRPAHQSGNIIDKLEAEGANIISFPLLEIIPVGNEYNVSQQLENLATYDLILFVSANAVEYSFRFINPNKIAALSIAAVGKKTAQILKEKGVDISFSPDKYFNSESLLALPEIQALGKNDKVVIIKGEGGRELLKISLQSQGVEVDCIDVYKRICPQDSLEKLTNHLEQGELDIILLTSGNSATNLFDLRSSEADNSWLNKVPLLLGSERIERKIKESGITTGKVITAEDPSDETMCRQLFKWATKMDNSGSCE